jgi:DNA-binding response OmpR family regulator
MPEQSATALVVEDDDQIAEILRFMLEREGYTVHIAPDGRSAQELIGHAEAPSIVILDIMLPYVDGYEVLAGLRGADGWRHVAVIILSARSSELDIARGLEAGADDYMVKPFKLEELRARIHRLVKK